MEVVISTHAVLANVLTHGFVKMAYLTLLIFDEGKVPSSMVEALSPSSASPFLYFYCLHKGAHHCSRGHLANKIMQNFYHLRKAEYGPNLVPHILDLSTSPILRSKI